MELARAARTPEVSALWTWFRGPRWSFTVQLPEGTLKKKQTENIYMFQLCGLEVSWTSFRQSVPSQPMPFGSNVKPLVQRSQIFLNMIVFPYAIFVLSADLAIFYQSKVWTCFSFIFMTGYIQVVHERAHRLCSKESKFKLTFFMIYNSQPSNEINIAIFGLFSFCHISSCMYVIQMMSSVCVTIKKKKACPNLWLAVNILQFSNTSVTYSERKKMNHREFLRSHSKNYCF